MSNHFKIIVPFYNVEEWIKVCIRSVKSQSYKNFQCILIDDISTDSSAEIAEKEIAGDDRFVLVRNIQKSYALKNIYDAIELSGPEEEDIVVTLDGDDWLANKDVLKKLNNTYTQDKCWLTYGSYAEYPSGSRGKFAKQIPEHVEKNGTYRSSEWCSSHLRTFKYHLWSKIEKKDLLGNDGNFYRMAWDLAFMFPMLEMAGDKSKYIKDILYIYNLGNPLNDHKVDNHLQQSLEFEIRNKNKYLKISDSNALSVNLFDYNISHASSYNDTLEKNRPSEFITYYRGLNNFKGVTIFTDRCIDHVKQINSKYKVAWIMEPRALDPLCYGAVESNIDYFDFVLTYDKLLHERFPDKAVWIPADGLFVDTETIFAQDLKKTKEVSHIYSDKTLLPGHKLRHRIASQLKDNYGIEYFGKGCNPVELKSSALADYRFSIVVENSRDKNYFTEKILDCFACRTIPIYWGAPNIFDFFDKDSIITFETIDELKQIITTLNEELYNEKKESLHKNYLECLKYYDYDKLVYDALVERGCHV